MQSPFDTPNHKPILSDDELNILSEQQWLCKPDAFTTDESNLLLDVAQNRYKQGLFRSAKIGRGQEQQEKKSIRGDEIFWLENNDAELVLFQQKMLNLQTELAHGLMLPIQHYELHWARYPANSVGYDEHLDQSDKTDVFHGQRLITFVLYLNKSWQSQDGGQLSMRLADNKYQNFEPNFGTLLLFRSDKLWHRVLPAKKERWSLTGWFRRL